MLKTHSLPRETETAKKAGASEKNGDLSKNLGFFEFPWISQFSIGALNFPKKFCLWWSKNQQCSYQHVASVLCRAGLETLLGNYSYISQMHALQLSFDKNVPTNNDNFCTPGAYITTWIVYLQNLFHDEQATSFLIKFVRAKTISGPKNPIMAAYRPDPQDQYFFTGSHGLITFLLRVKYGFLKAGVLFKLRKYGFSTG